MKVVLISGKQGAGKTTLADNLSNFLEYSGLGTPYRTRYAKALYLLHDAVRDRARELGIPANDKEGELLQWLGTEWGRNLKGQNIWVDTLLKEVAEKASDKITIIDDCRFPNEFKAFENTSANVLRLRLEASSETRQDRCSYWRPNTEHPSETSLDDYLDKFDAVIYTDVAGEGVTLHQTLKYMYEKGVLPAEVSEELVINFIGKKYGKVL